MNTDKTSIENVNERELIDLIEKREVNFSVLKYKGMDTIENLDFLFLLDRITITELAAYWKVSRMTVYRKIMKDCGPEIVLNKKINKNCQIITVSPKGVFDNIHDYEDFLKWRAGNKKQTVSMKNATKITGLTRHQLIKRIEKGKLIAMKNDIGQHEILNSSLSLFLIEYLINEKKRMEMAVKYLNTEGRPVRIELYLSETQL